MLDSQGAQPALVPPGQAPILTVIVDTEEEFDWSRPLSRNNTGVRAIAAQHRAHRVFDRLGIVPTYLMDYPVATTPSSVGIFRDLLQDGRCEVGAHLHPWVNPPHDEAVNAYNSYAGNLPAALERAKLTILTEAISQNLDVRPIVYKAGRYGVGPSTAETLSDLGYRIDASVVPFVTFSQDGGPDFRRCGLHPCWFGRNSEILELPLTAGFTGALARHGAKLHTAINSPATRRLRLPGILSRAGVLERIRLTPEGAGHDDHRRLTESLLRQGCRVFSFTYHSPSLEPGQTPYVRDESELARFLDTMERYFDYFLGELGGETMVPTQIRALLDAERSPITASAIGRPPEPAPY